MSDATFADNPWLVPERPVRPSRQRFRKGFEVAAVAYAALAGILLLDTHPAVGPGCDRPCIRPSFAVSTPAATPVALPPLPAAWLDPRLTGGAGATTLADNAPVSAAFQFTAMPAPPVVVADVEPDEAAAVPEPAVLSPLVADVPLPMPRPAEFGSAARLAALDPGPVVRPTDRATSRPPVRFGDGAAAASPDNRSLDNTN